MMLAKVTFRISCSWSKINLQLDYGSNNAIGSVFEMKILGFRCSDNGILPFERAEGGMLFSYQNLSPFFKIWNCCPRRHPNVGPTTAPDRGRSASPPMNKSISSTC